MGRYTERDDLRAEEMFERLIGYSYAVTTYEEEYSFTRGKGAQIQLMKEPITVESCQGYVNYEPMRYKGWSDIPLETITIMKRALLIPPSFFGVGFSKVRVSYTAGELVIPEDVKAAVTAIGNLLITPNMTTWNLPLDQETLTTIEKYKRERG